jgi:hypothetical protein
MVAASRENGFHNCARDILWLEDNVVESWVSYERADQRSTDPSRVYETANCQQAGERNSAR